MKEQKVNTIFILLLNEGIKVWRPVKAVKIETNIYKIMSKNKTQDDEKWEFNYQDLVKCKQKKFTDGKQNLVAYEKYTSNKNKGK